MGFLRAWNKAEVIKKTGYTGPIRAATCKYNAPLLITYGSLVKKDMIISDMIFTDFTSEDQTMWTISQARRTPKQ